MLRWGACMLLSLLAMPCAIAFVLEPSGFIRLAGMLNAQSGSSRLPPHRRFKQLQKQGMANALRDTNHDAEGGANLNGRCTDDGIVETILHSRRVFLHSSLLTGFVVSSSPQQSTAADLRKYSALAPLGAPTSTGEKSNGQSIFSLATALTNEKQHQSIFFTDILVSDLTFCLGTLTPAYSLIPAASSIPPTMSPRSPGIRRRSLYSSIPSDPRSGYWHPYLSTPPPPPSQPDSSPREH